MGSADGKVLDCQFPFTNLDSDASKPTGYNRFDPRTYGNYAAKPVVTYQSMVAAHKRGYRPYYPMKSRRSSFFDRDWFMYDTREKGLPGFGSKISLDIMYAHQPFGLWVITDKSKTTGDEITALGLARDAYMDEEVPLVDATTGQVSATSTFTLTDATYAKGVIVDKVLDANGASPCENEQCLLDYRGGFAFTRSASEVAVNIASRMMQFEALAVAQTAYFVAVVEVQWANVIICKTRYLSVTTQGMMNSVLNFGLMFEFMLCSAVAYAGFVHTIFVTENMRLAHWFVALPFAIFIVVLDEARKYMMRRTSRSTINKETGRMVRYPGWLETNTYY